MLGRTRIALLAGVFAIGIGGCGGDDGTIPQSNSEQILSMLTLLQNQIETGDCTLAEGTATKIDSAINDLPDSVDPEVQDALSKGAENLTELANSSSQCVEGATGASGAQTTDTTDASTSTTTEATTSSTTETTTPEEDTGDQTPSETPPDNQPTPDNETPPGGGNPGGPREPGDPTSGGVTPGGKG